MEAGYVRLDEIERLPRNPKEHDLGEIHTAYSRFGFIHRIIINRVTGHMIAGHGRVDTLRQLQKSSVNPPEGIELDKDGSWRVPVDYVEIAEAEEEAAAIALNRLEEKGGWDETMLAEILTGLASDDLLDGIGFDGDDLDDLLDKLGEIGAEDIKEPLRDESPEENYIIQIECRDERQQTQLLERFTEEGLSCRALIS